MIAVRAERRGDADAIGRVVSAAFAASPHGDGGEATIVEALRAGGALSLSLVVEEGGEIVGHAAFSPVLVAGAAVGWFGLAPLAVRPDKQRRGCGRALVEAGLRALRDEGAGGCVVFGDPDYYGRFGFCADPAIIYPPAPPRYFLSLAMKRPAPKGEVAYHSAFG